MSLIPRSAQEEMERQDAARAKARETTTYDSWRKQFTSEFARDIEMIRQGAIVTKTVAEHKLENNIPLADGDETRPYELALPSGEPVPTPAAARRNLQWARFTRFLRRVGDAFATLVRNIRGAWKGW